MSHKVTDEDVESEDDRLLSSATSNGVDVLNVLHFENNN